MGKFARDVQEYLRDCLEVDHPRFEWTIEHDVAGTPVDILGEDDGSLVCVELEWRRADPADNTAKLFRHLSEGTFPTERVIVYQIFTNYYDLASGGISSKRLNAEFVGQTASETLSGLSYHPIEFAMIPPKRGVDRPDDWQTVADETASEIALLL
jgi:hypothetical protein